MYDIKISIIIPVFNVKQYLHQCLDSVLNQTFNDWEAILVDDGSTDDSGVICDRYACVDKRIKVYHIKNIGSSAARSFGLKKAIGDYLYFVDADDWIDNNSFECQYECIKKNNADFIISPYFLHRGDNVVFCDNKPTSLNKYTYIEELFGNNNLHGGLWCKFIKKELFDRHSIQFPRYDYYEDMYVTIALSMNAKKICYNSNASYHYRVNEQSQTFSHNPKVRLNKFKELASNMEDVFSLYNLWNREDIAKSFYGNVNNNKLKLLELPYKYRKEIDEELNIFPQSYRSLPIEGKTYLLKLLALKYRIILPYHIAILIKKLLKN